MSFSVIEFCTNDGVQTFSDSFVKSLFDRLVAEGTAKYVFYNVDLDKWKSDSFLRMVKTVAKLFVVFKGDTARAMIWFTWQDRTNKSAHIHFAKLGKEKATQIMELASAMIDFLNNSGFRTIFGIIPESNSLGIMVMKAMGAVEGCCIPNAVFNQRIHSFENGIFLYKGIGGN